VACDGWIFSNVLVRTGCRMFRCFQVYIAMNRIDNVVNSNVSNAKLMHMLNFLDTFSVGVIVFIYF